MSIKAKISTAAFLAAAGLSLNSPAWALGLGDVQVESFLNQPLNARIDLLSKPDDDLASVTAKLASAADYQLIGASRESVSVPISFTIEDIDGDAYIQASSNLPITDPIVRLIVEVDWASGRLLREYTLFLDPASIPSVAPAPQTQTRAATPPSAVSSSDVEQPTAAAGSEASSSDSAPTSQPASRPTPAQIPSGESYGPVQSGENLWSIATDWSRGTGMNVNQVMLAIQRENPQAFMNNNINLLKRGAILRMPEADDVRAVSNTEATNEVREMEQEYERQLAGNSVTSASTPLVAEDESPGLNDDLFRLPEETGTTEQSAEPKEAAPEMALDTAEPEASADPEPEVTSQLELVPPSEASELESVYGFEETDEQDVTASDNVTSLRENLARTEEDLINEQQQNEYLQQRIAELEAQIESDQQEGSTTDADLASMEQRLREERQQNEEKPWYSGMLGWLIALAILLAGVFGWLFSRRSSDDAATSGSDEQAIQDIKDEAEEVLRVLDDAPDDEASKAEAEAESEVEPEIETEPEPKAESEAEPAPEPKPEPEPKPQRIDEDEASVLDEDSSDPEIQLDLARAYISMGDREAARVILEEVLVNGNEKQKAEAQTMRDHLS